MGDDCLEGDAFSAGVAHALSELTAHGVPVYLMLGNRDFLMGSAFSRASGARLLPDPTLIELSGIPTLLMHGDSLCTDDAAYQDFHSLSRSPEWQSDFLSHPLAERLAMAAAYRRQSEKAKADKTDEIMDVNPDAVAAVLRAHSYPRLIHGHTHRPAHHEQTVDGRSCERWVLPDWRDRAVWLECHADGCIQKSLTP